jgi:radical SAM protein with 4Fe4S-binding SPASM domain
MNKAKEYSFFKVEIEINHECNRVCVYCPNAIAERKNQGRMEEKLFVRIMEQLQSIDYRGSISFHFYNEPLLSPDLDRFTAIAKEYLPNSRIDLYTNGILLTRERLESLIDLGIGKFMVTQHHGNEPYAFAELFPALPPEIREKIKFRSFRELVLSSRGGVLKNVGYAKEKPPFDIACYLPSTLMVITVNGNVLPCFEDFHEKNVMGNVSDQTIMEIWKSPKYVNFRESLKAKKRADFPVCRECNCVLILP